MRVRIAGGILVPFRVPRKQVRLVGQVLRGPETADMFSTLKLYAALAAIIGLAGFVTYGYFHLINKGKAEVEAADKAARDDERAKIKVEQAALNHRADEAEAKANATQASFDDYMRNHTVASIGVHFCANSSGSGSAGNGEANGGNEVPGTGPAVVPAVSERSLDGAIDTILRASGRLATLYQQYQQQPEIGGTADAGR